VDLTLKKIGFEKMPKKWSKETKGVPSRFAIPVLISESGQDFEARCHQLEQDLQPQGIIESSIVLRIAQYDWEISRYQRVKTSTVNLAFKEALLDLLQQLGQDSEEAKSLAESWFNEPEAKREVAELLQQVGLDEYAIVAEAVRKKYKELEAMESILSSVETRFKNALGALAEYRNLVRSRRGSSTVIEAERVAHLPRRSSQS
jgi:hypothetical protein